MIIDGTEYVQDVIVHPDHIEDSWWRRWGHSLLIEDIQSSIERSAPEVLIVGTGKYGALQVLNETAQYFRERGIELIADRTDEALKIFNQLSPNRWVVGAFHLTC